MEIQNITGTDSIPQGFSVNSDVQRVQVESEDTTKVEKQELKEENKGNNIDTYA